MNHQVFRKASVKFSEVLRYPWNWLPRTGCHWLFHDITQMWSTHAHEDKRCRLALKVWRSVNGMNHPRKIMNGLVTSGPHRFQRQQRNQATDDYSYLKHANFIYNVSLTCRAHPEQNRLSLLVLVIDEMITSFWH